MSIVHIVYLALAGFALSWGVIISGIAYDWMGE